jgi:hypothetical protein
MITIEQQKGYVCVSLSKKQKLISLKTAIFILIFVLY